MPTVEVDASIIRQTLDLKILSLNIKRGSIIRQTIVKFHKFVGNLLNFLINIHAYYVVLATYRS
ncbi:hypothetical protein HanIR_Chr12g0596021 [Helianthus annuus]|nr:hypothetical protein HanIR_Chr12g0596021 [Helianthus annuus]